MKKRVLSLVLALCLGTTMVLSACGNKAESPLDPDAPITISFWHSYNNLARTMLENMIIEFNDTVGAEKGIIVEAFGFGQQDKLEEALFNSSNDVIGSEKMPDMFMSYADNAYRIDGLKPLADLGKYFTKEEQKEFRAEFLQGGIWSEGGPLKSIPIAKSTELLYINETDWDTFAQENNVEKDLAETFSTWEGIVEAAEMYYEKTGEPLLGINLNTDMMLLTAMQMGQPVYTETAEGMTFEYSKEFAKRMWEICYVPHINGWFKSAFYNTDAIRQGALLSQIGSSAGAALLPSEVPGVSGKTYPIKFAVVEYPTFEGAERYLAQRGADVCVTASEEAREYAATTFIKWFVEAGNNTEFAVATGYMPVKEAALQDKEQILANIGESDNMDTLKSNLNTTLSATENMKFLIKRPFHNSYEVNAAFSFGIFEKIEEDLLTKESRIAAGESGQAVIEDLTGNENFEKWYEDLISNVNNSME